MFHNDARLTGVTTARHETSAGPCELPILYRDVSLFAALWRVDAGAARALLASSFEPWTVAGAAVAMLCVFEYRDTSIGPYGELGVGILARRRGARPSWLRAARDLRREPDAGLYVVNLPVTTERARAAGVELWGFPKYVTDMTTEFSGSAARVALGRELEITLPLARGRGLRTPGVPLVTWSVTPAGRIARTTVDVNFTAHWGGARGVKTRVLGRGPTADTFAALGLDNRTPLAAFRTDRMQSILPIGDDVGPADERAPAPRSSAHAGATP